ncbi:hypothetical protein V6Z11_A05G310500 [Gossypium hirsutum]
MMFQVPWLVLCTSYMMERGGLLLGATLKVKTARSILISTKNLFVRSKSKPILTQEEAQNLKLESSGTFHQ